MSNRTEIGLAVLLAVALIVAVLAGHRQRRAVSRWERVSTYTTGPTGGRGPYDVLARLGVPVERRRTPLFDIGRQARGRPAVLAARHDVPASVVAGELPVAVHLHYTSQLAVGCGIECGCHRSDRQGRPESLMTFLILALVKFCLPQRPFKSWEQVRYRLSIIPYMGT